MRWEFLGGAEASKLAVAQALLPVVARRGCNNASLEAAARAACGDGEAWRTHFPRGMQDAIWFISEASDASMAAAFAPRRAASVANVIQERLEQNAHLKRFVFRVMLFDLLHPLQAVARMQRTAFVMRECLAAGARAPDPTALNWTYTFIVFIWLIDRTVGNAWTLRLNTVLMRLIGG